MSDTAQNPEEMDLDTLTDDQIMELGPEQVQALMDKEGQEDVDQGNTEDASSDEASDDVSDDPTPDDNSPYEGEETQEEEPESQDEPEAEATDESEEPETEESSEEVSEEDASEPPKGKAKDKAKSKKDKKAEDPGEEAADAPAVDNAAVEFMEKVTAKFKADGQEMQVRSAEDVIRLMQMGVNYSRRMQEMKPLRAQDAMLKQHGLNDPVKLSYLIDLSKGKPDAIQKLLKENNIDPLDIDTSKDPAYQNSNYSPDTKDVDFEEAIQNTLAAPNGQELINDVNRMWDDVSKEALRDQPDIFNNLLAQMDSGVYSKIKDELNYQRTLGHLTTIPFLQAYHQVGAAMEKAGVFGTSVDQSGGMAPLKTAKPEPIDTGTRKAADKPKTKQPNPNLSSTPRSAPSKGVPEEKDFSSMSDEDFLKLGAPG